MSSPRLNLLWSHAAALLLSGCASSSHPLRLEAQSLDPTVSGAAKASGQLSRDPSEPSVGALDDVDRSQGLLWRFRMAAPIAGEPVVAQDGRVYIATTDGALHALNSEGVLQWSFTLSGTVRHAPSVGPQGRVYVSTSLKRLYALTPEGRAWWIFRAPVGIDTRVQADAGNVLYFGGRDDHLWALSARAGVLWRAPVSGTITSGPVLDPDGRLVAVGTATGQLTVLRGGSRRRNVQLEGRLDHDPLLFADGTALVLAGDRLTFVERDGRSRWQRHETAWVGRGPRAELVAVSKDATLWRLRAMDGTASAIGVFPALPSAAPLLTPGGELLAGSSQGQLWISSEGARLRVVPVTHGPLSAVVADLARQRVLVASGDGTVAAVSIAE